MQETNMNNNETNIPEQQGFLSIILNIILFIFKLYVGIITSSVAIMADAWHTLSDSLTSVIVIVGARTAKKPADKGHPYGHGRIVLISAIIIGVLLCIVGFNFLKEAIHNFKSKEFTNYNLLSIIIFSASVIIKEGLAQFAFWGAKKTGNSALKADGWHHRSDAIASTIILIGIFFGKYLWWIDSVLGVIVSLIIIYTAIIIIKDGINPLLGEEPDKELINSILKIGNKLNLCQSNIHHFHLHSYGKHNEITFHIALDKDLSLEQAHETTDTFEKEIKNELGIEATIHVDTYGLH